MDVAETFHQEYEAHEKRWKYGRLSRPIVYSSGTYMLNKKVERGGSQQETKGHGPWILLPESSPVNPFAHCVFEGK
jgi:hypothetical protein